MKKFYVISRVREPSQIYNAITEGRVFVTSKAFLTREEAENCLLNQVKEKLREIVKSQEAIDSIVRSSLKTNVFYPINMEGDGVIFDEETQVAKVFLPNKRVYFQVLEIED